MWAHRGHKMRVKLIILSKVWKLFLKPFSLLCSCKIKFLLAENRGKLISAQPRLAPTSNKHSPKIAKNLMSTQGTNSNKYTSLPASLQIPSIYTWFTKCLPLLASHKYVLHGFTSLTDTSPSAPLTTRYTLFKIGGFYSHKCRIYIRMLG